MPTGIYHRTEEMCRKTSEIMKKYYAKHPESLMNARKVKQSKPVSEETKRKMSESLKGKIISLETRKKHSDTVRRQFNEGQRISPFKLKWKNKEWVDSKRKYMTKNNPMKNKENVEKMLKTHRENGGWKDNWEYFCKKCNTIHKNPSYCPKGNWNDKIYREKTIKAQLNGLLKRPTSLEQKMIDIINRNNLPYKYTGNGEFLIGFKNPDFVNVNGQKICIEVANIFHHQGNYEEKRKEHFAKYGWKCIVFKQDILNENEVLEKLSKERG
jgi:very-short-patch-repair endonuclease